MIQVSANSQVELIKARNELRSILRQNSDIEHTALTKLNQLVLTEDEILAMTRENITLLIRDIFEADIDPVARYMIATGIRCGRWYEISQSGVRYFCLFCPVVDPFIPKCC